MKKMLSEMSLHVLAYNLERAMSLFAIAGLL
jgi:hypothetical protein